MPDQPTFGSWWPFTFAGVARFAYRPLRVLLLFQFVVACVGAAAIMFYFQNAWWPLIPNALNQLPASAKFDQGQLYWPNQPAVTELGRNALAAIVVDPDQTGKASLLSDVQIVFGVSGWRIRSLLGYTQFSYGNGLLNLNPSVLKPVWGAWKPAFLVMIGAGSALAVFASWIILAAIGAPIAKLMSFFADRDLKLSQAWKLCSAALMPGALFFSVGIALYAYSRLNLLGLGLAAIIHLLIGGVYMLFAPWRLPKKAAPEPFSRRPTNPFRPPQSGS